jgi:hypothetical protein
MRAIDDRCGACWDKGLKGAGVVHPEAMQVSPTMRRRTRTVSPVVTKSTTRRLAIRAEGLLNAVSATLR